MDLTINKFIEYSKAHNFLEKMELGKFHFNFFVNIPISVSKENPTLYLHFEFINWILSLPQLKTDELLKHKLYIVPMEQEEKKLETPLIEDFTEKKEFYNYIEVFTYTMNYELNQRRDLWLKCDYINTKICLNSLRVVIYSSNSTNDIQSNIQGIQLVIDSLFSSTKIFKKPLQVKHFNRFNGKKLFKWAASEFYGKVKFIYASFFDGVNLLELKPKLLYNKRKKQFPESINNPVNFCKFFNLSFKNSLDKRVKLPHLVFKREKYRVEYHDFIINSLFREYITLNDSNIESDQEEEISSSNGENEMKDLEFNYDKIFFKIDSINFEKYKKIILSDYLPNKNKFLPNDEIEVSFFCRVRGFKFLVSNLLKDLLITMFQAPIQNFKKLKPKRKKMGASNFKDSNTEEKWAFGYKLRDKLPTNITYSLAFLIDGPEFNIFDEFTETQVLMASQEKSVCLIYKELLQYDNMELDPKINIKMIFNALQLYTAPSKIDYANRCFWLDDTENKASKSDAHKKVNNNDIRKGVLNRILKTDYSLFHYHFFTNSKMFIDFTRPLKE